MQAEHIQIMKLMHDIAELSEKHNITEHEPIGNYRLKVECKSPYRFGSVVLESYKVYDYGTTKKGSWDTMAMYIRTSRHSEQIGSITPNMIFVNALHEDINRIVESNFDDVENDTYLEIPPELDQSEDIREAYIFQRSVLDNFKEFEYMMLCYETAKAIDTGELVMYSKFINCESNTLKELHTAIKNIKDTYERL